MKIHTSVDMDKNAFLDEPEVGESLLGSQASQQCQKKPRKLTLKTIDIVLSCSFICVLVVSCWRGTWILMDIYSNYFSIDESFVVSVVIYTVFALSQTVLHEILMERKPESVFVKCTFRILTIMYQLLFYLSTIMYWRSGWVYYDTIVAKLYDYGRYLNLWESDVVPCIFTLSVLIVIVMYMKLLTNQLCTPMNVKVDTREEMFLFDYKMLKMGEKTSLYVLDCLFSILVVGTLVVFVWRGVWLLIDIFLFPNDEILSSWSSLILGYIIVALAFLLQPIMRYICERLTGAARLLVADLFILFALFGTVNVWRGIWNLLNIYFLPDNLELSCWITHWVSLIILILCRCSNSLLVRGVYIDAEEPAGKCVVFPCYYLRVIFRKKKLKKLNLTVFALNDSIKVNHKESENVSNNHVVNISTISNTVEEDNDFKQSK